MIKTGLRNRGRPSFSRMNPGLILLDETVAGSRFIDCKTNKAVGVA